MIVEIVPTIPKDVLLVLDKNKIKTPRQIKSEQTKNRIFEAAQELIKKYGFEYLTVKNICEVAKVSNGTFYHNFSSKDEVMSHYLVNGYQQYVEQINDRESEPDFIKRILNIYTFYGRYCEKTSVDFIAKYYSTQNKALCRRDLAYQDAKDSEYNSIIVQTAYDLRRAKQDGQLKNEVDPASSAADLCTMVKGIIFEWALNEGNLPLEKTMNSILGTYLIGLSSNLYRQNILKYDD